MYEIRVIQQICYNEIDLNTKGVNQMNLSGFAILIISTMLIQEVLIVLDINSKQHLIGLSTKFMLGSWKHCILHTYK
jgi:hypothetical protein